MYVNVCQRFCIIRALFYFFFVHLQFRSSDLLQKSRITLDYKSLFQQIIALLSTPGKAWSEIAERGVGRSVMPAFVYPLIGLCGLSEFIGKFIGKDFSSVMFQVALTRCCAVAVALFGGFFLSAYLLDKLNHNWLGGKDSYDRILVFVGYSMVVTFVLNIVSGLFSIVVLHWILQIYTIVIVFEGVRRWLKVEENKQTAFTLVATIIILVCPAIIEFIFNKLSVILN